MKGVACCKIFKGILIPEDMEKEHLFLPCLHNGINSFRMASATP